MILMRRQPWLLSRPGAWLLKGLAAGEDVSEPVSRLAAAMSTAAISGPAMATAPTVSAISAVSVVSQSFQSRAQGAGGGWQGAGGFQVKLYLHGYIWLANQLSET